jgi:hypothetical protein
VVGEPAVVVGVVVVGAAVVGALYCPITTWTVEPLSTVALGPGF